VEGVPVGEFEAPVVSVGEGEGVGVGVEEALYCFQVVPVRGLVRVARAARFYG